MNERRKEPRHRVLKAGKIIFNHGNSVIDCTIRDLSDKGAALQIASPGGFPKTFDLLIPQDGFRGSCRLASFSPKRVGVSFELKDRLAA